MPRQEGAALVVNFDLGDELDLHNWAFCYLPLPLTTSFPSSSSFILTPSKAPRDQPHCALYRSAAHQSLFPMSSIDTSGPFGVQLYALFDKVFQLVAGYPAEGFQFVGGETHMSTLVETGSFVVL